MKSQETQESHSPTIPTSPKRPHKKRRLSSSNCKSHFSPAKTKESVINCNCIPKVESEDEFYISCDYCSEWFHGHCNSMDENIAKGIHTWYLLKLKIQGM